MSWLQAPKANQAPGKRPRRDPEKSAASKLDYETKRKRNFLPSWTEKFPWLRYTEEAGEEYMMYCSTCRSLPDIADTSSSLFKGTGSFRYDTLSTHALRLHRMEETMLVKMTNIMHAAYYVARTEQPFTHFTTLHGLIKRTGGQLPNCYASNMASFSVAGLVDWRERLVGFGSDGAAVNVGCRTGVATRFKEQVPHLIPIHCIAHRLELGVVSAIKENPKMQQLQATLCSIYEQYHYAPKALRELRMIAEAMEEKVLKPTTLHGARWVPYVHCAAKVLCDSFPVILAHFEDMASLERRPKPSAAVTGRAKKVSSYLKDYGSVLFLHFLCHVLDHLATLSKVFQKDSVTVCEAVESQERCFWNLSSLKTRMGLCMETFVEQSNGSGCYKGVQLNRASSSTLEPQRAAVIDAVISHLDERLKDLHQDSIVAKFRALDPSCWPKYDHTDAVARETFTQHGQEEIKSLSGFYKELLAKAGITPEEVIAEYAQYKSFALRRSAVPMRDIFLSVLQSEERRAMFRCLCHLIEIYMVLPVSTAVCERGFSTMKRVKTDWRSSLTTAQLQRLMFISIQGPALEDFDAASAAQRWWTSSLRRRRPGFNPWSSRERGDEEDELVLMGSEDELEE
ncbi:Zinc finger protein 862 [Dissostichus eleginoides]|uniref:Zinc finger protein 862 n=2 Tax=Dissostichus eleginoides TaxID=100907 RepID=A0AAD9C652_DISEL|nr:Zinc finger protein 862 [Dissostichus eleginoides]